MDNSAIAFMTATKLKIRFYLDNLDTAIGKSIAIVIAVLVLISAGIFVAETYPIPTSTEYVLDIVDNLILCIFVFEYLLRLWSAENKLQYIFSLYSLIDLVAILPFFFVSADTKYIRLLRWFRFLRIFRFLSKRSENSPEFNIFARVLFTLFAIVFIFSGLVYQFEHIVNPKEFGTFLDAFYFSIFTMTTVGYGDVTPTTVAGKSMTILMILTGIALIPVQLGELFKGLIKNANQINITCSQCGFSQHDSDAICCKICGTKLLKS